MSIELSNMEFSRCPLGCPDGDDFVMSGKDILNHMPGNFKIVKCRTCGLQRTNPRPSSSAIHAYYPNTYQCFSVSRGVVHSIKLLAKKLFGLSLTKLPVKPPGHLLEIGCSTGDFLKKASSLGWKVDGIEPSSYATMLATRAGLNVRCLSVEDADFDLQIYDLIIGWMVLEHLHDPVLGLNKLYGALKKDGYLVISVPDVDSVCRKVFKANSYDTQLPTHLYHFNSHTLCTLLDSVGFRVVKVKWQNNPDTIIRSFEFYFRNYALISWCFMKLRTSLLAQPLRLLFGFILGVTKQSGRIEVWAKK